LQGQRPKLTDEIRRRLAIKGRSIGMEQPVQLCHDRPT